MRFFVGGCCIFSLLMEAGGMEVECWVPMLLVPVLCVRCGHGQLVSVVLYLALGPSDGSWPLCYAAILRERYSVIVTSHSDQ